MDKREKILKAVRTFCQVYSGEREYNVAAITDAVMKVLDEPAEPKRDWLKVDTDTPKGTLAVNMDNGNPLAIDTIKTVFPCGSIRFDNLGRSDKAERFIGIHLLDNPGLDAPPCEGMVFFISSEISMGLSMAHDLYWGKDRESWIMQWAPVKWVDGKPVVDIDRLRGES